jgi:hypothetical protein
MKGSTNVQILTEPGQDSAHKGGGYYLMELRQHVADSNARRQKLLINDWAAPEIQFLPILQRPPRIGPQ